MKRIFYFQLVFLLFSSLPNSGYIGVARADGEVTCARYLSRQGPEEYRSLPADFAIGDKKEIKLVTQIAQKYLKSPLNPSNNFIDLLSQIYEEVKLRNDLTPKEKAEIIGNFAMDLDPYFEASVEKYPVDGTIQTPNFDAWARRQSAIDNAKAKKFVLSMAVSDLENFANEDYIEVSASQFFMAKPNIRNTDTHIPLSEYPKYVESYISGNMGIDNNLSRLYSEIPERGEGGILSIPDIRDITSYNVWPMYLKAHDIRHIHYGISHPYALATMMRTTRSRVPLRYTMMGGLYEGVDRVQYTQEQSINRFFATELEQSADFPGINRNLDLEESMLMLAYMPEKKLIELTSRIKHGSEFLTYADQVKEWRPKRVVGTDLQGFALTNGGRNVDSEMVDLDDDVREMVFNFEALRKQSEALKGLLRVTPDLELTESQKMLLWTMNFQLDPANPEIVIPGLRFKNDGRAHFRGDSNNISNGVAPIGIGDH